ncbi:fimbria/pilus outer membrane usher protein [Pseudomonas sp. S1Bt23]|uniref:fimbria/pilus outer membrane usher protein n=1 Tax=Pseudomonas sp. S1Bt23 TaxID=3095074 RepID=UPI0039BC3C86
MSISFLYRSGLPVRVVRSCTRQSAPWLPRLIALTSLVMLSVSAWGEVAPTRMNTAVEASRSPVSEPEKQVTFDSQMLNQGEGSTLIDITRFERPGIIPPGTYRVDLLVNDQWRGTEEVEFKAVAGEDSARFCYDRALLVRAGIDLVRSAKGQGADQQRPAVPQGQECVALDRYVPGASVKFDMAQQKLYIVVAQYYLQFAASRTYVDPEAWDSGVTAALLNYNSNLFSSRNAGASYTSGYAGLNMGLNLGAWRLRHNGTANWSSLTGSQYQRGYTYAQSDLAEWSSQLLLGESATNGELFDSVSFRGVQLFSDDRMLPDTQRYYAPVVRGTASSNAKVSVYQRGYLVYETTVAPGPFEISDLQAAGFGGDLQVTVTEANGQASTFTVPFATTVQLLRPGSTRYSATVGQVTDLGLGASKQLLAQGTLQRGLDNRFTGYGGFALTGSYMSGLLGAAVNTTIGGFATDLTLARTDLPDGQSLQGSSARLSFSKSLPNLGTHFSLLAYRYSTDGYLGLHDAVALRDLMRRDPARADSFGRLRSRLDANISQRLGGDGGSLYLNGASIEYWNRSGKTLSFSLGYSNQWRGNSYSITAQRTQGLSGGASYGGAGHGNTLLTLSLSIPLGRETRGAPVMSGFVSHDDLSGTRISSGVSGALDEKGNAAYALSMSGDEQTPGATSNASLNYRLPQVSLGASFSQGRDYRQGSVGASGGVLVHEGGVTLSQPLGETIGLVHVPRAEGAHVGYAGSDVDGNGYAIVPSLTPYQLNSIDIDPAGMPEDIELQLSSRSVAPRAGAVVMLDYPTRKSRPLLIDSRLPNGDLLPFAAMAIDSESGLPIGAVGQGSRLVVRSDKEAGSIRVEWGSEPGQQCLIDYVLPVRGVGDKHGYDVLALACRALPAVDAEPTVQGGGA